jgi:hypothetical protein
MVDRADVRRIALSLPGTSEGDGHFAFSVKSGSKVKGFAWAWMERVHPRKPRVPRADVIAVRVANLSEKEMLLASGDDALFTEPHYDGFPAVLVRLADIDIERLEKLLTDAWRAVAPRATRNAQQQPPESAATTPPLRPSRPGGRSRR